MSDFAQVESSQRQFNEQLEHESRFRAAQIAEELAVFAALKPSLQKDGDMWCVLLGDNLQEGVAAFGKSPLEAIRNFNAEMDKEA
jgi:hypothetical protein